MPQFARSVAFCFLGTLVSVCHAGLIVSFDEVQLDANGQGQLQVFAESNPAEPFPQITSYSLLLRVERIGAGMSELEFADDGESLAARQNNADHLFAGTTPFLFSADVFDSGRQLEVVDSVGLFDPAAVVDSRQLLLSANLQVSSIAPLIGNQTFLVSIDPGQSNFFDDALAPISTGDIVFGSTTVSAVPEPSSALSLLIAGAFGAVYHRRRQNRTTQRLNEARAQSAPAWGATN